MQIEDFVIGNYYSMSDALLNTWYVKIRNITNGNVYVENWAIMNDTEYKRDIVHPFIDKLMLTNYNVKEVQFSDFSKFLPKNNPEIILHRKERINKLLYER